MSPTPSPSEVAAAISETGWTEVVVAIASIVTAVAAVVGLGGLWIAAKEAARTRHASLVADFLMRWDEPPIAESRRIAGTFSPERLRTRLEFLESRHAPGFDELLREPNFLEAGVPAKVVQEVLGHSSAMVTLDIYSHVVPSMKSGATQLVADQFSAARQTIR